MEVMETLQNRTTNKAFIIHSCGGFFSCPHVTRQFSFCPFTIFLGKKLN